MKQPARRHRSILCAALACACLAWESPAAADESLAARNLRGYGLTKAEFRDGSTVVVTAESPEKALLWAARYDHVYAAHRVRNGVYRLPGAAGRNSTRRDASSRSRSPRASRRARSGPRSRRCRST